MKEFVRFLLSAVSSTVRSKLSLQMEIAALRHQLSDYQRTYHRPRVTPADRILWSCIAKIHGGWEGVFSFRETKNRHRMAKAPIS